MFSTQIAYEKIKNNKVSYEGITKWIQEHASEFNIRDYNWSLSSFNRPNEGHLYAENWYEAYITEAICFFDFISNYEGRLYNNKYNVSYHYTDPDTEKKQTIKYQYSRLEPGVFLASLHWVTIKTLEKETVSPFNTLVKSLSLQTLDWFLKAMPENFNEFVDLVNYWKKCDDSPQLAAQEVQNSSLISFQPSGKSSSLIEDESLIKTEISGSSNKSYASILTVQRELIYKEKQYREFADFLPQNLLDSLIGAVDTLCPEMERSSNYKYQLVRLLNDACYYITYSLLDETPEFNLGRYFNLISDTSVTITNSYTNYEEKQIDYKKGNIVFCIMHFLLKSTTGCPKEYELFKVKLERYIRDRQSGEEIFDIFSKSVVETNQQISMDFFNPRKTIKEVTDKIDWCFVTENFRYQSIENIVMFFTQIPDTQFCILRSMESEIMKLKSENPQDLNFKVLEDNLYQIWDDCLDNVQGKIKGHWYYKKETEENISSLQTISTSSLLMENEQLKQTIEKLTDELEQCKANCEQLRMNSLTDEEDDVDSKLICIDPSRLQIPQIIYLLQKLGPTLLSDNSYNNSKLAHLLCNLPHRDESNMAKALSILYSKPNEKAEKKAMEIIEELKRRGS